MAVLAANYIVLGTVTTGTRPASPAVGTWVFNTTVGYIQCWNGSAWFSLNG
jgi:hypothetical protein